jgi:hypothetical protein
MAPEFIDRLLNLKKFPIKSQQKILPWHQTYAQTQTYANGIRQRITPIHHPGIGEIALCKFQNNSEANQGKRTQPPATLLPENHHSPGRQNSVSQKMSDLVAIADIDFDIRRRNHRQHDAKHPAEYPDAQPQ